MEANNQDIEDEDLKWDYLFDDKPEYPRFLKSGWDDEYLKKYPPIPSCPLLIGSSRELQGPERFRNALENICNEFRYLRILSDMDEKNLIEDCLHEIATLPISTNYKSIQKFLQFNFDETYIIYDRFLENHGYVFLELYEIISRNFIKKRYEQCKKLEGDIKILNYYSDLWYDFLRVMFEMERNFVKFYQGLRIEFFSEEDHLETKLTNDMELDVWDDFFFKNDTCIIQIPLIVRELMQQEWNGQRNLTNQIHLNVVDSYCWLRVIDVCVQFPPRDPTPLEAYKFMFWHKSEYPAVERIRVFVDNIMSDNNATNKVISTSCKENQLDKITSARKQNIIACRKYRINRKKKRANRLKELEELVKKNENLLHEQETLAKEIREFNILTEKH